MPVDLSRIQIAASAVEIAVLLAGGGVIWWVQFSRKGQRFRQTRLPGWAVSFGTFGLAIVLAIGGAFLGTVITHEISTRLPKAVVNDTAFGTVILNSGLHLGVLLGVVVFALVARPSRDPADHPPVAEPLHPPLGTGRAVLTGILTFCATAAILLPVSFLWDTLLKLFGIPLQRQELIEIFAKADTPAKLLVMAAIAIVIAPMTEELTFRAGLFRFLRGRIPAALTYVVPAALFAALHNNLAVFAPLLTLGIVFSVAYERTGRILVPVIAHALFNLNTILLILIMGVNV